jgi:starch phosphorylase
MTTTTRTIPPTSTGSDGTSKPLRQYRCGPVELTETDDGLYERHLLFDNVVQPTAAGPRERFEAFARSLRDILSQRWVLTEDTYERENPGGAGPDLR